MIPHARCRGLGSGAPCPSIAAEALRQQSQPIGGGRAANGSRAARKWSSSIFSRSRCLRRSRTRMVSPPFARFGFTPRPNSVSSRYADRPQALSQRLRMITLCSPLDLAPVGGNAAVNKPSRGRVVEVQPWLTSVIRTSLASRWLPRSRRWQSASAKGLQRCQIPRWPYAAMSIAPAAACGPMLRVRIRRRSRAGRSDDRRGRNSPSLLPARVARRLRAATA